MPQSQSLARDFLHIPSKIFRSADYTPPIIRAQEDLAVNACACQL
jgi:hypothetical protein